MHDVLLLTKILLKNNNTPLAKNGKKKSLGGTIALMALCELPFAALLYFQFMQFFQAGLSTAALQFGLLASAAIGAFTVLFSFPTVFYFSRDVSLLMPLPLPSWVIVAAKFLVVCAAQLGTVLMIELPLVLAYAISGAGSVLQVLLLILQCLLVPVDTLLVLGILTILVMALLPGSVNKDRFNLVVGVLTIVLALTASIGGNLMGQSMVGAESQNELIVLLQTSPELMEIGTGVFVQCMLAVKSIGPATGPDVWWLLLSAAFFAAVCGLFLLLASRLYFRSAAAAMVQTSGSKKQEQAKQSSLFFSYCKNRCRLLLRTPAYVTNLVMSAFMMPVIVLAMCLVLPTFKELQEMTRSLDLESIMPLWALFLLIGLGFGFFSGSMNGIAGTSFSRDGQNLAFYKAIPMPMEQQMRARLLVATVISAIGSLLFLPVLHMFLVYNPLTDIFFIMGCLVSVLIVNQIGLLVDAFHPKLVWDDETAAVKNNYNVLYEMFISWIVLAIVCVPMFFVLGDAPWASLVGFGLCVACAVVLDHILCHSACKAILEAH